MSTFGNPLVGSWPNPGGANPTQTPIPQPPAPGTSANPWGNPSQLANPQSNVKDITRSTGYENLLKSQFGLGLAPQWAQFMQQFGGNAGNVFSQMANLGSPFYQRKQQQSFEQGTKAAQDAAAQSRQKLQAAGAGYTPSGAGAAMFGGEAQAEAGNQAEAFLNNLFQNEQLQLAGAQGLGQLASLFNPQGLLGSTPAPGSTAGPTFASQFADIMGGLFGGGSKSAFQQVKG